MFSPKDQLRHALNITFVVSLYTVACCAVFFLGSWLGLSLPYQAVLVLLILLTWPFAVAVNRYRRQKAEPADALADSRAQNGLKQTGDRAEPSAPARQYDELTRSAAE